ncbi:uncharacterized protein BCR38DRAFT_58785 [Pseudomassariella vexata]|uniref:Mcm2 3 5 family protein n=1 Tax=Pseudomassariella vexata TaxID=1141098 RepID=A0A1Y2DJV8_9PEZI|nr:uncharacterized protein BCR38DRAFT_58785 [Pseudomassariella vexata]ORY59520.1 hypothetical protein BCR38DRAFT_58785 [Pseudomassariella vexata]
MAADRRQDEALPEQRSISSVVFSAFSRQPNYQRMDSDSEIDLAEFKPTSEPMRSMDMPSKRQSQPPEIQPVSPLIMDASDQNFPPLTGRAASPPLDPESDTVDIATSASAPASRKAPRRTRFTEMLRSSVSSPLEKGTTPSGTDGENSSAETSPVNPSGTPRDPNHLHPITEYYSQESRDDTDNLSLKYTQAPVDCHSKQDVHIRPWSWLYVTLVTLSIYSTLLSGLWFVVSIYQPRYGRGISSGNGANALAPATASTLAALFAKTIELSFVTVFVGCLGQVLTRRSFIKRSTGITLAEMTMRNWVIQPGSLFTHWKGIPYAARTVMGVLTLLATLSSTFYTTASDAMVTPKLKFGDWQNKELSGLVRSSYANPIFAQETCTTPINLTFDVNALSSCLDVQYSGQSFRNLLAFMKTWQDTEGNQSSAVDDKLQNRPTGTALLFDNTTLTSSWIESEFGDPAESFKKHHRIINNVTLAMPHPGVYTAATDPVNEVLQPSDLSGVGEYQVRASVVAPTVNVMCVNMAREELDPLIYTSWPHAINNSTDVPGHLKGHEAWLDEVPVFSAKEWLNKTVVDDIFRWGEQYGRRPPVFQLFPIDYNMITNTSVIESDAIYILAKSNHTYAVNYNLCELRSWLSPKCSTQFNISGISGAQMKAYCEDPDDKNSYLNSVPGPVELTETKSDWRNFADQWRLSMDLNGGVYNSNASNARIMGDLILQQPRLSPTMPSMAEALAVLASSTLVVGSLQSTYKHYWDREIHELDPGVYEVFNATLKMQQYTSGHVADWQVIFYFVLGLVFFINVISLLYLISRRGMVTDFTEPQNLFALAVNSPPSQQLQGSCGGGPQKRDLVVPWRVGYAESANHYYFEEANDRPWRGRFSNQSAMNSGTELLADGSYRSSYKRLSSSRTWL